MAGHNVCCPDPGDRASQHGPDSDHTAGGRNAMLPVPAAPSSSTHPGTTIHPGRATVSTASLSAVLLAIHAGLLTVLACTHAPLFDELARVAAGFRHWELGDLSANPGNPPLNDPLATAPVMLLTDQQQRNEFKSHATASEHTVRFVMMGRLALIPISVLGGWICFCWTRDLFGSPAALLVLAMWCFDPMILAHGALITGDIPAAVAGIGAMYAFHAWMQQPDLPRSIVCGITLGLALLAKFVWVLLPPLWVLLWLVRRFAEPRPIGWPRPGHTLLIVLVSVYVVNAGFGFAGSLQPLSTYEFRSRTMQELSVRRDPNAASTTATWIRRLPIPLPRGYLSGIDAIAHHVEPARMITYAHGKWHEGHVWYFYLYGLLVKLPLGTWLLLLIALIHRCRNSRGTRSSWHTDLVLWLPALAVLLLASSVTSYKFLRYVLPMLPFLLVWTGQAVSWAQTGLWPKKAIVTAAAAWSITSSLLVYPHSLSYFNEAAGGTWNGHAHLLGPSYDYGQDYLFLKTWLKAHPEAWPLYIECSGFTEPGIVGIQPTHPTPQHAPEPGWYVLNTSVLRGALRWHSPGNSGIDPSGPADKRYLELFLHQQPVASAGYSIRIYHLNCHQANRMREQLGLELLDCGELLQASSVP